MEYSGLKRSVYSTDGLYPGAPCAGQKPTRKKPMPHENILLITTDQQSATMLGCAGNSTVRTPHTDALAADGVRFEKAYAAQPLCGPQRCSWYTGLMPHQHGITFNLTDRSIRASTMMGRIFRDAGYATGYSGKWHISTPPENKDLHGFEWMNNIRENGADQAIATDFKTFLETKGDRPFLFSASFNNPHNICEATRGGPFPDGHPGMFEHLNQLPPLPDNFAVPEREPSVIRLVQKMYSAKNYPTANWDETRWRLHRWYYSRITELVDRRIGELLDLLEKSGLRNDTRIVFTSDHGEGNAHHQWNQKQTLYDESARVPFILTRPGSGLNRVDAKQLVNTGLDLIPTLCGLAGIACPSHLAGQDWSEAVSSPNLPQRRDHVIVETEFGTYGKPSGYMGRAVRTERYKYMVYNQGDHHEFLVDMEIDPGETTNLVGAPEHEAALERHRSLLRDYITQTGDIFPLPRVGVWEDAGAGSP